MLQSIYASKLYKTSSRKSRIKAAVESPLNVELVSQLAKSLDEEYQTDDYLATQSDKAPDATSSPEGGAGEGGSPAGDGGLAGGGPSGGGFSGGFSGGGSFGGEAGTGEGEFVENEDEVPEGGDDSAEGGESPEPDTSASEEIAEATKVKGKPVKASTEFKDMGQVAEQIKGLLNFKDSTTGVSRTCVKENEFWIYYNDDINLNNIMSIVIDTLNGSGYAYLEFNRLARSDNAIVFEIDFKSSDNQMKIKQGTESNDVVEAGEPSVKE